MLLTLCAGRGSRRRLIQWLVPLALLLTAPVSFRFFRVKGLSMEPALVDGQLILADTLTGRWLRPPRPGDVIVFRDPRRPARVLVKRVIAVPPETVHIVNGLIHIDGRIRHQPDARLPRWVVFGPRTVPPEHFFVLGDNQYASRDSLSWGLLPAEHVIGKVRQWPGLLSSATQSRNHHEEAT
jgi:signal peptidase I